MHITGYWSIRHTLRARNYNSTSMHKRRDGHVPQASPVHVHVLSGQPLTSCVEQIARFSGLNNFNEALCRYGVAVFAEPRSGGEGSVGIPHPMYPPWANHRTSELLLKVWHKREGWCGPPMVGRPVITVTPARAFCTGLEVGGFRFRRTLPNHVETEPSSQVGRIYWGRGPRGYVLSAPRAAPCAARVPP